MNVKGDVNSNLVKFTKKCQTQPPHYEQTTSLICNCPPGLFLCPFRSFHLFFCFSVFLKIRAGTYHAGVVRLIINVRMNTNIQSHLAKCTGMFPFTIIEM